MDNTKQYENEIVKLYNLKKVKDCNLNQQDILHSLFKCDDEDLIKCDICNRYSKPDFYFEVNGIRKYISLKSGRSDSMHFEEIKSFILFLRSLGVSVETQKTILLFHYGDGTLNGVGKHRMVYEEVITAYGDRIRKANEELNTRKIIKEAFKRFVTDGTEDRNIKADYLMYGDKKYSFIVDMNKLYYKHIGFRTFSHINTLHIGPMTIQPYLRDVTRISKHPEKRQVVQIKWHYLLSDLERIK